MTTTVTVNSGGGADFTTIQAAIDDSDVSTEDYIVEVQNNAAYVENLTLGGSTGTPTIANYLHLTATDAAYHGGTVATGARVSPSGADHSIEITENFARVSKMLVELSTGSGASNECIRNTNSTNTLVERCILDARATDRTTTDGDCYYSDDDSATPQTLYNCLLIDADRAWVDMFNWDGTLNMEFCTGYRTAVTETNSSERKGIIVPRGNGSPTLNAYNTVGANNVNALTDIIWDSDAGSGTFNGSNNASSDDDDDVPATNAVTSLIEADAWTDPANFDLTILDTDSALYLAGTDRSGNLPDSRVDATIDIRGVTRPATPSIGAFEFDAGGPAAVTIDAEHTNPLSTMDAGVNVEVDVAVDHTGTLSTMDATIDVTFVEVTVDAEHTGPLSTMDAAVGIEVDVAAEHTNPLSTMDAGVNVEVDVGAEHTGALSTMDASVTVEGVGVDIAAEHTGPLSTTDAGVGVEVDIAAGAATDLLRWSPPAGYEGYTVFNVGDGDTFANLDNNTDYLIVMPNFRRTGTLRIRNGRNVVIIGGHCGVDLAAATDGQRQLIRIIDNVGIVHIEGVLFDETAAAAEWDAIIIDSPQSVVQIQNCRIEDIHGSSPGFHGDMIQPFGGCAALRIDRLTASSDYQGLFIREDLGLIGGAIIENVNLTALPERFVGAGGGVMLWHSEYPITLSEVYIQQRPGDAFEDALEPPEPSGTWPYVVGAALQGQPPGGDFVPVGVAGTGYVSPGYLAEQNMTSRPSTMDAGIGVEVDVAAEHAGALSTMDATIDVEGIGVDIAAEHTGPLSTTDASVGVEIDVEVDHAVPLSTMDSAVAVEVDVAANHTGTLSTMDSSISIDDGTVAVEAEHTSPLSTMDAGIVIEVDVVAEHTSPLSTTDAGIGIEVDIAADHAVPLSTMDAGIGVEVDVDAEHAVPLSTMDAAIDVDAGINIAAEHTGALSTMNAAIVFDVDVDAEHTSPLSTMDAAVLVGIVPVAPIGASCFAQDFELQGVHGVDRALQGTHKAKQVLLSK